MKLEAAINRSPNVTRGRVFAENTAFSSLQGRRRLFSLTRSLRIEQSSAHHEQIGQRGGDLEPMQILRQTSVANFLEAEDAFDYPKHVLDFGADLRFAPVRRLDRFVDSRTPSVTLVSEVTDSRRNRPDRILLTPIRLVTPDTCFLPVQQVGHSERIGHVGRGCFHRVDQLGSTVDSDVGFHPEIPLLSLRRLMHLGVSLAVLVLRRARRSDDCRIDDRAVGDLHPVPAQILIHRGQQLLAQLVLLQQMPELAHRRLIGRRFYTQVNPDKSAHRGRVIQRLLDGRVRQVEPQLQKIDPQHPLQWNRRPATGLTDLRVKRFDNTQQLGPRKDLLHVCQKLRSSGRLAVLLKRRQGLLLHGFRLPLMKSNLASDPAGKSEFP